MKLKDWYNLELVEDLAKRFDAAFVKFPRRRFVELASDGLESLEMMDRVRLIASAMESTFPQPTSVALRGLQECMGPALDEIGNDAASVTSGYALWPFGEYIGRTGLDDWESSWSAMDQLTQRLTSEFAVRPFLAADLSRCLDLFRSRLDHPSHHVRRWISEGTRTRLPWAKAVPELRRAVWERLELLEQLKDDPSLYVRRSVANHLQDILKDDLDLGLEVVERWFQSSDSGVAWVVRHACRGLLKAGHPRVLALYGWDRPVELEEFRVEPQQVLLGQTVRIRARLGAKTPDPCAVRLDYSLEGPTPSGGRFRKVFRWTEFILASEDAAELEKLHPMVERSTRKLPEGDYQFRLLLNGQPSQEQGIRLIR